MLKLVIGAGCGPLVQAALKQQERLPAELNCPLEKAFKMLVDPVGSFKAFLEVEIVFGDMNSSDQIQEASFDGLLGEVWRSFFDTNCHRNKPWPVERVLKLHCERELSSIYTSVGLEPLLRPDSYAAAAQVASRNVQPERAIHLITGCVVHLTQSFWTVVFMRKSLTQIRSSRDQVKMETKM